MTKEIPEFLQEMLLKDYGEILTNKIKEGYKEKRLVTLRVNNIKSNSKLIKLKLEDKEIKFRQVSWSEDAFIIENASEDEIKKLDIYINGEIYLQSLSSMIPPLILAPKPNENILDMAAAPGGKTTQIAALSKNEAMITACERNNIRAEKLKYNLNKQGATRVNVMMQDARQLDDFFSFDKILLDSPCSGSGTTNIYKQNFTKELINKSKKLQEELLNKAINILKPYGEMIYSTCSILKEENENILNKALDKKQIEIIPIDEKRLKEIPLLPSLIDGTLCIAPNELYEGFFIAKIRRKK